MLRRLLTYLALIAATVVSAQTVVLPGEVTEDSYASVSAIDLTRHLPEIELRDLARIDDDYDARMAEDLLSYARTFLGIRYRRGGKSPAGFDCSGFTGYVFREFGYRLSASSAAQYGDGVEVSLDDIRPGDLLFFKGRASKSTRIGHVGIAIEADPDTGVVTFIHASCSQGISIDRTSAPYYAKRFVGARRVLGN